MLDKIKGRIHDYLNSKGYYTLDELTIGGHCGCCGEWIPNKIGHIAYNWLLCDKCSNEQEQKRNDYMITMGKTMFYRK